MAGFITTETCDGDYGDLISELYGEAFLVACRFCGDGSTFLDMLRLCGKF